MQKNQLVVLSAAGPEQLTAYTGLLLDWLDAHPDAALAEIACTLQTGREPLRERLAVIAGSVAELRRRLANSEGVLRGTADEGRLPADATELEELARQWVRGSEVDWNALYPDGRPARLSLPTPPFATKKYWVPEPAVQARPLLGVATGPDSREFATRLTGAEFFLRDHAIGELKVLPAVAALELAAATAAGGGRVRGIVNVLWSRPVLVTHDPVDVRVRLAPAPEGVAYEIRHGDDLCSAGTLLFGEPEQAALAEVTDLSAIRERCPRVLDGPECYEVFDRMGGGYGPSFQPLRSLASRPGEVLARVEVPDAADHTPEAFTLHPSLLDGMLQAALWTAADPGGDGRRRLPFALTSLEIVRPLPRRGWVHAVPSDPDAPADAEQTSHDLTLLDDDGRLVLRMRGLMTRVLRAEHALVTTEQAESVRTLAYTPVWRPAPLAERPGAADPVLVIGADPTLAETLGGRMVRPGGSFTADGDGWRLRFDEEQDWTALFEELKRRDEQPAAIVWDAISLPADQGPFGQDARRMAKLFRGWSHAKFAGRTRLLYCHADRGALDDSLAAALDGLAKAVANEQPAFLAAVLTLAPEETGDLAGHLAAELGATEHEFAVSRAGGERRVRRWEPVEDFQQTGLGLAVRDGGVYLITGGLGGLGRIFAAHLAAHGRPRFVLTGRSPEPGPGLEALRLQGVDAVYWPADLGEPGAAGRLVERVRDEYGALHGVLHLAGVTRDGFLLRKTEAEFDEVLAPKVRGTIELDRATADYPLDFFVVFSSMSGVAGTPGQADYAFANRFLDSFAGWREARRREGRRSGRTISLLWSLWADGGIRMEMDAAAQERMVERAGLAPLPTSAGLAAFDAAISLDAGQVVIARGRQEKVAELLVHTPKLTAPVTAAAPAQSLTARTEEFLRGILAGVFGMPAEDLDPGVAFEAYGIDSILIMDLTRVLEEHFGSVPKTLFFEYQDLASITGYFVERHADTLAALLPSTVDEIAPEEPAAATEPVRYEVRENEPIAIIGMSARFAGSDDLDALWENLRAGRNLITEIPADRWDWRDYDNATEADRAVEYSRWGSFLDDIDKFDPLFFGISPREAEIIDPQERLFLETAWHTIEDAGYTRQDLRTGRVGVYVGAMYALYQLYEAENGRIAASSYASIANRVSYSLGLNGPSLAVDTMCSSALSAIHLAIADLRNGDTDLAIAGGVNLHVHPYKYRFLGQGQFTSSDGLCRSFGEGGDGYVPGEGVGAVLLKPLSKAIADRDHVYGTILGSSVNHGGRTNGFTVPNPVAQGDLIGRAIEVAGVDPASLSYVEAHGTGTSLGDPVEIRGLSRAFVDSGLAAGSVPIGSVKSNIGHLESAAGMAALGKVLAQLRHRQLAPSIHADPVNPNIDWADSPFYVQREVSPWTAPDGGPLRAGISSFGAGGANAHLVISEAPSKPIVSTVEQARLFPFSAKTVERLAVLAGEFADFLDGSPIDPADLAFTLQVGREALEERAVFQATTVASLVTSLRAFAAGQTGEWWTGTVRGRTSGGKAEIAPGDLAGVAQQWVRGATVEWARLDAGGTRIPLPGYPFERLRCWITEGAPKQRRELGTATTPTLLDRIDTDLSLDGGLAFTTDFGPDHPLIRDHRVGDLHLLPGVAALEMARAAAEVATGSGTRLVLRNVRWLRPLVVGDQARTSWLRLRRVDGGTSFTLLGKVDNATVTLAQGDIEPFNGDDGAPVRIGEVEARCAQRVDGTELYADLDQAGLVYGPALRGIDWIVWGAGEALARIVVPEGLEGCGLPPALLDSALHTFAVLRDRTSGTPMVPYAVAAVEVLRLPERVGYAHVVPAGPDRYDLTLTDESGAVCVRMRDLALRPVQAPDGFTRSASPAALDDLLYAPDWVAEPDSAVTATPARAAWVIRDRSSARLADELVKLLGGSPQVAEPAGIDALTGEPDAVYLLHGADTGRPDDLAALEDSQQRGVLTLFRLVKRLRSVRSVRFAVVTEDACGVREVRDPFAASLHGLTLSLAQEFPQWTVSLLDSSVDEEPAAVASLVTGLPGTASPLAVRGGVVHRRRLLPVAPSTSEARFRRGGVYLILGGAGGIGLELTEWLVREFGAKVVLVGRSELDEAKRQRLQALGPVSYRRADAGDAHALSEVVQEVIAEHGALHGVFHSTIVLRDQLLQNMDEGTFRAALDAKTKVSVALLAAVGSVPLDFVLFFSSAVALSGSAGQSNYAAGSTFEDAFAHFLGTRLDAVVRVINWGFWGTVGIVAQDHYRERLARQGIFSLDPAEGMAAVEHVLGHAEPQVVVTKASREVLATAGVEFPAGEWGPLDELAALPPVPRLLTEADDATLDRIMLDWLWTLFRAQGVFTGEAERWTAASLAARIGVQDKQQRLFAELLRVLTVGGYLTESGGELRVAGRPVAGDPERELAELCAETPALNRFDVLLVPCMQNLFGVLRGEVRATDVMFPGGSTALVEGAYRGSPVVDRANHLVTSAVRGRVAGQPLRVLEIGAGTGGTTAEVLPALAGTPDVRYVYTDISMAFLRHGRERFGADYPFVEFKTLDVSRDLGAQGFTPGEFDLVIAANVLHATGDLLDTLGRVVDLLADGGWLVLNEASKNVITATLTFGLLDGWWLNTDAHLRLPGSPLLSGDGWRHALDLAGFSRSKAMPADEGHTQHVVVAEKAAASVADSSVLEFVRSAFREVLQVPDERLFEDETYENFGIDSLTSSQVVDRLTTVVPELPATLLFEYPTIRELVDYFTTHHAAHFTPTPTTPAAPAAIIPAATAPPAAPILAATNPAAGTTSAAVTPATITPSAAIASPAAAKPAAITGPAAVTSPVSPSAHPADKIAIIGVAGRYPGARDLGTFWHNLRTGRDSVTEVPADRWNWRDRSEVAGTPISRWGGFLDGIAEFDPKFFQMSKREAEYTDPQERLFLQTAWETLEDGGYPRARLRGSSVGVYVGVMYGHYQLVENSDGIAGGMGYSSIANRVSYFFDFQGPSLAVDTMCSSSLTALHLACEALRLGEIDYALAGGVNLTPHPRKYTQLATGGFTSSDGRCRSFGDGGDGMVPGEGVGAVLLKPLAAAERDGDRILGVVLGSAVNHGGKTGGFAVPNPQAQGRLIGKALEQAGVEPQSVSYVEAHGTGTALGDPAEMAGLTRAFGTDGPKIALGSLKSNVGHLESAAGIGALTKVLLQLRHRELVPSLHADRLNQKIDWSSVPFEVQRSHSPWTGSTPLRAGVSAFGAGGSNAHLVVEEYPEPARTTASGELLFVFSAQNQDRLRAVATDMVEFLGRGGADPARAAELAGVPGASADETLAELGLDPTELMRLVGAGGAVHEGTTLRQLAAMLPGSSDVDLTRVAFTLQAGREAMGERLAIVASTVDSLLASLRAFLDGAQDSASQTGSVRAESWLNPRPARPDGGLHELARRWTAGEEFDWFALYPSRPAPISLPTYPFERVHCWIPERAQAAPATPSVDVRGRVLDALSEITGFPAGELDPDRTFGEHGLDSLSLVKLAELLGDALGVPLTPDVFLAAPTVTALTERLRDEHTFTAPEPAPAPAAADDPVVIVGMAGVLPGGRDLESFWAAAERGEDLIGEIPADRWDWREFYGDPAERADRTRVNRAGFMPEIDKFDPLFFGISAREAKWMDPRQRLLLQTVWSALEDGGIDPRSLAGSRTGLFVGVGPSEYAELIQRSGVPVDAYASTGLTPSMLANRISYHFDFHGPSEPVDTACSSSLVALHRAAEAIELGHCETVIAGGVSVLLSPVSFASLERAGMLSPDGVGRAFDAEAAGYVRGEGVGAVVLKRLSRALADGNPIHAVLRGVAINHGGRSNSLTAPNPAAQADVILRANAESGVDPSTIGYIETHGTGTMIGDPAEVNGLREAFTELYRRWDKPMPAEPTCALVALKNVIGHLEPAAGIAGLLRALLALRHRRIPGNPNVRELNSYLRLDGSPFHVPTESADWPAPDGAPRRAGLSSFGYGGVNAHVVLEEYAAPAPVAVDEPLVFTFSAKDPERLRAYVAAFAASSAWTEDLAGAAYTLQVGRPDFPERLAFVARTPDETRSHLHEYLQNAFAGKSIGRVERGVSAPRITSGTPEELAEAWVRGAEVDWAATYRRTPRLRSLPTYPFAADRHWFTSTPESPVTCFSTDWEPAEPVAAEPVREPVLVFARQPVPLGDTTVLVRPGDGFRELPDRVFEIAPDRPEDYERLLTAVSGLGVRRVAHLWSLTGGPGHESLFLLLRAAMKVSGVTLDRIQVGTPDVLPHAEMWGGFAGSLRAIAPEATFNVIRLDGGEQDPRLLAELSAGALDTTMVRHHGPTRLTPTARKLLRANAGSPLREGATYLVSGGMGGLGIRLASMLAKQYGARIALVGRSPLDAEKQARLAELRALGGEVEYFSGAVDDRDRMAAVVAEVKARWGALHGVFHLAGTVSGHPLPGKDLAEYREQLRPRIGGPTVLDEVTRDEPLDLFVLYSSIAGHLGDYGLVDYGVGARFLDGFAGWREQRRAAGERQGHTVSIGWPMWRDGGMHVDAEDEQRYLTATGFRYLSDAEGERALDFALRAGRTQLVVLPGDPARMTTLITTSTTPNPRKAFAGKSRSVPAAASSPGKTRSAVEEVRELISGILDTPVKALELDAGFGEYGLDSFGLKTLSIELEERYGVDVPTTTLFGANTIAKLAAHLTAEFGDDLFTTTTETPEPTPISTPAPAPEPVRQVPAANEPIAIIGMSGRFPGSPDLDGFWRDLDRGQDLITETPPERWDWRELAERFEGTARWGGFLDRVDEFDSLFFKISPLEAEVMDPQHRLFLEHAWKAIEDAACRADQLAGRAVSVFVGTQFTDYEAMVLGGGGDGANAYAGTGLARTMLANRLSYLLDLRGPSESIDTACSSSLVAVHRAVKSLRSGETELSIVGGVSLILAPQTVVAGNQLGVLSPDGRCKTMDASADGYVKGEGVAALVLKPLSRALADGDRVHAVIRGSAVGHGGHASSLTAPNPEAQADLLVEAYRDAGVPLESVSYLELHGTGTELGDPIEIEAIQAANRRLATGAEAVACGLGTVKSNIGHLEPAAGVAGMLKVILAMRHRRLPATLHVERLNPLIRIEGTRFSPVLESREWPSDGVRRAGVSSFGFGGVNSHVVLEEAGPMALTSANGPQLVVLSARTADRLRAYAAEVADFLGETSADLDSLAYTSQVGRVPMTERLAVVATSVPELRDALAAFVAGRSGGFVAGSAGAQQGWLAEPEGQDYLRRMVEERDLNRLARMWVDGAELDFGALHTSPPAKTSMPTYPFEPARHWLGGATPTTPAEGTFLTKTWHPDLSVSPDHAFARKSMSVLVLAGEGVARVARELFDGATVVVLSEAEDADPEVGKRLLNEADQYDGVIDLTDLTRPGEVVGDGFRESWARVTLLQELIARFRSRGLFYLHFTRGLTTFRADDPTLRGAAFAGLCRLLPGEYRGLNGRTIDVDEACLDAAMLRAVINAELAADPQVTESCVRDGVRYLPAMEPLDTPEPAFARKSRTVLVTGGTGALGRLAAADLIERGTENLVLLGRRPLPERARWEQLCAEPGTDPELVTRLRGLLDLERPGVRIRVEAGRLDDGDWLRRTLAEVRAEFGPIEGVVHCAGLGVMDNPAFVGKRVDQMRAVLEPKVAGLRELADACSADPVRFFVLYSSIAAQVPLLAAGMSDYAMANAFLDRFAEYQAATGRPWFRSLQWPSWRANGMPEVHTDPYRDLGIRLLPAEAGLGLLRRSEGVRGAAVCLPCQVEPGVFDVTRLLRVPPRVARVESAPVAEPKAPVSGLLARLTEVFEGQLRLTGIDPDTGFADLGVDSIMIAQLMAVLERELGIVAEPSAFLENPTLRGLAGHLEGDYQPVAPAPAKEPAKTGGRIAIIGIAAHFPGAPDKDTYWRNLLDGVDSITEVPESRWDARRFYAPEYAPGKSVSKWGGFLDGIEDFDPAYFRIEESAAAQVDPLMRQFLEVTAECLADAGYAAEEVAGRRVGVFAGSRTSNFGAHHTEAGKDSISGMAQNFIAAHVSHFLDVRGPNLVVDSACSSSLVSVHLAAQSLRLGECEMALAGGVEILLDEIPFVGMSEGRALSPTGRCHTFDERADGIVLGEGAGALLLKRLDDALRDGDRVYAVLDGGAVNNDGRTMGITTPNPEAQREVIRDALDAAGVSAADIGYVEAHGTGTRIGDPMELKALTEVFRADTADLGFCGVGSVKTNVGHLLSAAGIAGLIKVVLAVREGQLPPTLHCETTNRRFRFEDSPLYPVRVAQPWTARGERRLAGISSFGFGGTNAHLIVGEAPAHTPRRVPLPPIRYRRARHWFGPPNGHELNGHSDPAPFFELRF
ncbi:SDR family NAD(P)-dependent oxidoreductase [Amycolatopsis magusensis]|uniref:SDR family NAD(P)-dependent oxidoreductase n=1 Tax=Amycolatopsis magusensis TaxID=882444 RepID=UPI0027E0A3D8|nr:SDR family NAD(P)-dependent oxidoreductase [Amycolatopsis magusensis]